MTANEAYNELNRVCLEMDPPQKGSWSWAAASC